MTDPLLTPLIAMALIPIRRRGSAVVRAQDALLQATTEHEKEIAMWYDLLFVPLCQYAARVMELADAEDLVQEAFIKICEQWPVIRLKNPTKTYFFVMVRNAVIDAMRAERRDVVMRVTDVEIQGLESKDRADVHLELEELTRLVDKTVAQMSPRCREFWILTRDHDCTIRQAAEIAGVDYETGKRHVARSHKAVREKVSDAGYQLNARKLKQLPPPSPPVLEAKKEGTV